MPRDLPPIELEGELRGTNEGDIYIGGYSLLDEIMDATKGWAEYAKLRIVFEEGVDDGDN